MKITALCLKTSKFAMLYRFSVYNEAGNPSIEILTTRFKISHNEKCYLYVTTMVFCYIHHGDHEKMLKNIKGYCG